MVENPIYDTNSRENYKRESIFIEQNIVNEWSEISGVSYTLTKVKVPGIYDLCKQSSLSKSRYSYYEKVDAKLWQGKDVYRECWEDFKTDTYLVFYENNILEINFEETPTQEQIDIVSKTLMN